MAEESAARQLHNRSGTPVPAVFDGTMKTSSAPQQMRASAGSAPGTAIAARLIPQQTQRTALQRDMADLDSRLALNTAVTRVKSSPKHWIDASEWSVGEDLPPPAYYRPLRSSAAPGPASGSSALC